MTKYLKSFKNFYRKLKSIDIQDLFEKVQSIDIEDLRYIDFKKILKSNLFYSFLSILSALISVNFLLIPAVRKSNEIKNQAKLFTTQANQLDQLNKKVLDSVLLKDNIDIQIKEISKLLISKNSLILIPRILNEAAKNLNISLIEIRPIQSNEIFCFYSEDDRTNSEQDINLDNKKFKEIGINKNKFITEFNDNQTIQLNQSNFFKERLENLFTKKSDEISNIFQSNFYDINLKGNFLDSITFMKLIQEYNVIIYPVCFEPRGTFSANTPNRRTSLDQFKNDLNIRLIINVPSNKNV